MLKCELSKTTNGELQLTMSGLTQLTHKAEGSIFILPSLFYLPKSNKKLTKW